MKGIRTLGLAAMVAVSACAPPAEGNYDMGDTSQTQPAVTDSGYIENIVETLTDGDAVPYVAFHLDNGKCYVSGDGVMENAGLLSKLRYAHENGLPISLQGDRYSVWGAEEPNSCTHIHNVVASTD